MGTATINEILYRPRRLRKSPAIRDLTQEHHLLRSDLVTPLFIREGKGKKEPIASLPGVYRYSLDELLREIDRLCKLDARAIALFPVISSSEKDRHGSYAVNEEGIIPLAVQKIKEHFPHLCVITDLALDPFTSHGHDGIINNNDEVDNDATVEILAHMALLHASYGVDIVAPSDMMDGRIGAIRRALDKREFTDVAILSYTAKYASSLYGPFREALGSSLGKRDKKGYQMNPANAREALREAELDIAEGADLLMIKPGLFYLDILYRVREITRLPLAAYHVSGEYAMIMAAGEKGWLDATEVLLEALIGMKRAGADLIFSYAAPLLFPLLPK